MSKRQPFEIRFLDDMTEKITTWYIGHKHPLPTVPRVGDVFVFGSRSYTIRDVVWRNRFWMDIYLKIRRDNTPAGEGEEEQ